MCFDLKVFVDYCWSIWKWISKGFEIHSVHSVPHTKPSWLENEEELAMQALGSSSQMLNALTNCV